MHQPLPDHDTTRLYEEAKAFIEQCYTELGRESEIDSRLETIRRDIEARGHYDHTFAELEHGARMAWRNSNRCVGRLFWRSLEVVDQRHLDSPDEMYEACCQHVERARNGGDITPLVTIFKPMIRGNQQARLWNYQLIRYAGYETLGEVVGDPAEVELTEYCRSRGWEGDGTAFDPLPLVVQVRDDDPELFELPDSLVEEIPLSHPEYDWFADLGLRWYDVPIVSNMRLEIGGISYTAAPFNGWYVSTEIGARNFADEDRYDMLPEIGRRLGLETSTDRTLWKDEALVELNRAVLHSFKQAGVRIVDHHTASEQFAQFERTEQTSDRTVTGDRSWLLPPMSSATTHVFSQSYETTVKTPNFFYLPAALPTD